MNSVGGIIYITGLFGAGKTTLINVALDNIPVLRNMPTYITRGLRPGEEDARQEITYVSPEEYERLRVSSPQWDHTEIAGTMYGTDASAINSSIGKGQWFIVASPMNVTQLEEMMAFYIGNHKVIYIDTDLEVANERLIRRDGEAANKRLLDPGQSIDATTRASKKADVVFKPTGDIAVDADGFISLIRSII